MLLEETKLKNNVYKLWVKGKGMVDNQKKKIFDWMYRQIFDQKELIFDEVLYKALRESIGMDPIDAERFVNVKHKQYWAWLQEILKRDEERGLRPVFTIKDEPSRRIVWFSSDLSKFDTAKQKNCKYLLSTRPDVLKLIDYLNDREYESLSCVVCRLLGAKQVLLTPAKKEHGIDFFAVIPVSSRLHIFGGINAPLRIIGQCKKYNQPVQESSLKDFLTTINDIKQAHRRVYPSVPDWFKSTRGPILGWFIAHSWFQSGAVERANEHGIALSDSKELAEIISMSRIVGSSFPPNERSRLLRNQIKQELISTALPL